MRYYVEDKKTRRRIYLRVNAPTRGELYSKLKSPKIKVSNQVYTINDIKAVPSTRITQWRDLIRRKPSKTQEEDAERFNSTYIKIGSR